MRIVIVGSGAVGSYLAERLSTEGQDVVVIEHDARRAAEVQETIDALVITGNGASASVLKEAGVDRADLLIAVSDNDGANLLACHAGTILGVKRTIARVEDPGLRAGLPGLGVDLVIDPGESAAAELVLLMRQSGVSDFIEFAEGRLVLVGGLVQPGAPLAHRRLSELRAEVADLEWVVAAVVRNGDTIVARGDTTILPDDHVLIMVTTPQVDRGTELIGLAPQSIKRVIILGGTRVAELTTDLMLEQGFEVAVVDRDGARCRAIAERHARTLVICGDPTDPEVLGQLGLSDRDAVLALSGWDEVNILSCLVAKALGAATTVSRFNRITYVSLLAGVGIDATVSSRLAAANSILRFVRRGRIYSVATFKDTDAEAMEIEVAGDSKAVGMSLRELPLARGAVIGGILRNGEVFVPTGATVIRPQDHLILFALPEAIHDVESLFGA